jgi:tetratricopeptide (TPR) repeat protein
VDPLQRLRTALADRYDIQREIGRGGMAIVYLAHDLRHSRVAALKVLRPEFAMAVSAERFLREIQIEAQLTHPNILPLFDSGDADGLPYYVMPYVPGQSLQVRLARESQLSLPEALRITSDIAGALSHAHSLGFVHRDVKPGNILLDERQALLADFGIARAMTELAGDRLSDSGLVIGTPEYMSPEQGAAHGRVDARSDIYSLGCVLYEMLSGEPPFTGPTAQSVIARHMHESPRSLRVIRETVPEHVEDAIRVALAKVPADRFGTTDELVAALGPEAERAATFRRMRKVRGRQLRKAGLAATAVLLSGIGLWAVMPTPPRLDPNKVVLFPLSERGIIGADSGAGYDVAVMLSAALDHAQPLKWIDGAPRLAGLTKTSGRSQVSSEELRKIARLQGAGFYMDGAVVRAARDSSIVVLRLHDTKGDSVVAQETAGAGDSTAPVRLALQAATRLLPVLVDPGRPIDLAPLIARKPSATALWIQGEREYRRSRFSSALKFYQRAIGEDSAMVLAAVKGAQAAGWEGLDEETGRLLAVAMARLPLLPPKHRWFAQGWNAYLLGHADSAAAWLRRALAEDPEWAEGHMALGEVYYHLLPRMAEPLDSLAQAHFRSAKRFDSGFAPPLFHLTEFAIRQESLPEAARLIEHFRRFQPDSTRWHQLAIMHHCVKDGLNAVNWELEAGRSPMDLQQAARSLSVGGAQNECAERAFRALLANPAQADFHWGAFLGLHGILMAEKRYAEIGPLIDSAAAGGLGRAPVLFFVDDLAGAPVQARAKETAAAWRAKYGARYEGVSPQSRWLLAAWSAHHRDTTSLEQLRDGVSAGPQVDGLPFREALEGFLAIARADTAAAVRTFSELRLDVPAVTLEYGLVEPLAGERMVLAESALARRDFGDALRITSVFDHPAPVAYLPFLPQALAVRLQAARGLDRQDLVREYQDRMRQLQIHAGLTLGAKIPQ